jgi:hypothetical protein
MIITPLHPNNKTLHRLFFFRSRKLYIDSSRGADKDHYLFGSYELQKISFSLFPIQSLPESCYNEFSPAPHPAPSSESIIDESR